MDTFQFCTKLFLLKIALAPHPHPHQLVTCNHILPCYPNLCTSQKKSLLVLIVVHALLTCQIQHQNPLKELILKNENEENTKHKQKIRKYLEELHSKEDGLPYLLKTQGDGFVVACQVCNVTGLANTNGEQA